MKYVLLNKSIFFPREGILAFGDFHIGYEQMLKENGLTIPISQMEETKKKIKEIIEKIKQKFKLKEIILLGDIKHYFPFQKNESFEIKNFLNFLEEFIPLEKITVIKGNHEKIKIGKFNYRELIIRKDIIFIHGDRYFKEIENKKVKYIVTGHLHPAIFLKEGVKKEKYKCFLTGKWKRKETIILPSFLQINEGTPLNNLEKRDGNFHIIPMRKLKKFNVHIIGKNRIYDFGELRKIKT